MKYELALALKNAGFPQREIDYTDFTLCQHNNGQLHERNASCEIVLIPTLSELIEACGENIKNIEFLHDMNLFIAYSMESLDKKGKGITTQEAVANLWLELNKDISSKITEL